MISPRKHDEGIAEMYHDLAKAEQQIAYSDSSLLSLAGAEYFYRGRRRVTNMTVAEAETIVEEAVSDMQRHEATHTGEDRWVGYVGRIAPYDKGRATRTLDEREGRFTAARDIRKAIVAAEKAYTGWSRFFLVTSSSGHIHSSMQCSTCRPTTSFGWLPQLSGKTEADAVAECGPTLCTVCYPTAPTEFTVGKKITAAQAAKKVA